MYTLSQSKNLCIAFIYIKIRCSYSPGRFPRMTALGIAYEINASKLSTFFQSTRLLYLFFERIQFDYFLWFQIEPIWNHARGTVYDKCQYRNFSFNYIIKFLLCITDSGCFFD